MGLILFLLISILSLGIANAGQVSSLTPDEVVKHVKDKQLEGLRKVWKELNIESKLYDGSVPENVERFDEEVDGREGPEVVLKLSDSRGLEWQFLIFSKRGEDWVFLGNIDYGYSYGPTHRIIKKSPDSFAPEKRDGTGWLVIKSDDFHGTGASLYKDHWWDLTGDRIKKVLVYAVEGHVTSWGMTFDRMFGSQILGFDRHSGGKFRVYLAVWAIYYIGSEWSKGYLDEVIFAVARRVVYVWDEQKGRFTIDPQLSEMTQEQVDGLYTDNSDGFLKHNLDELKKLASSKDEGKRAWLKRFLEDCSDGPDKTLLLELLR